MNIAPYLRLEVSVTETETQAQSQKATSAFSLNSYNLILLTYSTPGLENRDYGRGDPLR
jgi:hypothetical protein